MGRQIVVVSLPVHLPQRFPRRVLAILGPATLLGKQRQRLS